jgi:Leucine-rich repeat (LRR) protein
VSNNIANLQNLQIFHAYGNSLTGTIPASIYELRNSLRDLVLSENDFVGALPDGISNMHVLETLSLHQTTSKSGGLTGSLPDFAGCYALTTIHLGSNSITGELPEDFLLNSDYLDSAYIDVDLSSNYFEGKIPKSWSRIRLLNIDLSNNQIDHVSTTLCENGDWQNGFLGDKDSDCNYILCDKYSYNAQGRATASSPCLHCDSAKYFGATYCQNENTDNLAILEALFASTNGGTWKSSEGWFTSNDVCDKWYGIYCDDDGIDIVKIDLSDNDLSGTPSTAVYNLPKLRELSFARNPIDFSFDGIDAATKLEVLYLSQTRISSLDGIGKAKSLKKLHLTECYLSGPIPNELFNLVNLEGLFMNYNQFTGRIPTTIGQLVKLKKLFMMSNNLSGPIPAAIGKLSNLITLSLTDNAFSGSIPDEFNNLQSIEILAIEHERRNVASASSKNNRKLQNLQQSNRKLQQGFGLTGQLPSFNNLPNLKQLLLGYNSLTGSIPYNFLEGIKDKAEPLAIDLQYNLLEGTVPSSLTQFTNVQTALQGNKFTDVAPGLCSMTEWNEGAVKDLKCDAILCPKNTYSLIGRQTSDIECVQCPSFTASLYLGSVECISDDDQDEENERKILFEFYENLQGSSWTSDQYWYDEDVSFCKWYGITCAPGETDSVETIKLPSNGLEGHVPKAIFDLPNLQELHLGGNNIWISFDGIGKASKLQFLNLDATGLKTFAGIEASPSLKILHATMNELTTFPNEVLQLINLEVLYLSYNKFNMNLPNFSGLTKLGYFQCKECALTGVLPDWLGTMQSLRYLSLSHNILTGEIPSGLNELQLLEHLDLSEQTPRGGGLTGSVPDFKTLENLSSLYLNRNRLSGELNTSFLQKVDSYSIIADLRYNELTGAIPDSFVDRFNELTLLLAENKISSIPNGCDGSYDLEWNEGDVKEFGCDGLLCEPGFYSPIGRKTAGHRYNCVECDSDSKNNSTDTFFGSTTCGIIPDKVALEAIYNSLGGPDWSDSELWMENDLICEWYGVICDDDERVIELELEDNNLQGDVPTEIYDLTELKTINLKKNKISFSFSGIEKLTHLDTLNLSDIGLNSVEDLRAATSLRVLHLTGNSLTVIPDDVYDLINLEELYMNYNKMEGEISSKIGQLTGLVELFMFRNKLSGNIPKEIGQLKQLRTLGLGKDSRFYLL